tara:strand:+ start:9216 stop:9860 length:645 start_codon:yes stop_codon:yes gene_type:complete
MNNSNILRSFFNQIKNNNIIWNPHIDKECNNYDNEELLINNNRHGGCFHENSHILMANNSYKNIADIIKGDKVYDKNYNLCTIICLVKIKCNNNKCDMIKLDNGPIITPFHPIYINDNWIFPTTLGKIETFTTSYIYNLVLDNFHNVIINNYICVTLGHYINTNFVISHQYFGTNKVIKDLEKMEGYSEGIVYLYGNYILRDNDTDRVIRFIQY